MPLSVDQVRRFARHISLPDVGPAGQERLLASTAFVCGTGLAAQVAQEYLTAAGVGRVVEGETRKRATVQVTFDSNHVELRSYTRDRPEAFLLVNPGEAGAAAVVAGTLAATELLWRLLRDETEPDDRILRLSLDGSDPLVKDCP